MPSLAYSVSDLGTCPAFGWGDRFASCWGDRQVFLWDVASGRTIRKYAGHEGVINAVCDLYCPLTPPPQAADICDALVTHRCIAAEVCTASLNPYSDGVEACTAFCCPHVFLLFYLFTALLAHLLELLTLVLLTLQHL